MDTWKEYCNLLESSKFWNFDQDPDYSEMLIAELRSKVTLDTIKTQAAIEELYRILKAFPGIRFLVIESKGNLVFGYNNLSLLNRGVFELLQKRALREKALPRSWGLKVLKLREQDLEIIRNSYFAQAFGPEVFGLYIENAVKNFKDQIDAGRKRRSF